MNSMMNSKGDVAVCRVNDLWRIVCVYRMIHLRKKIPTSELPGYKSLLRAQLLHTMFWVFEVKVWVIQLRGRLRRVRLWQWFRNRVAL